ncbi:uncharacterized protein DUF2837 [Hasllibacter halocynthiae]|uniref:Uncharacterized protein DUF2837 n=1 Tax=Hasllibacter halocynthiae TaxID=595589 RepID=A0A2T0X2G5_9RHOB|nr:DUF2837 family protein [Hasllibacter halocynthiae]PRY93143.1 uncharacterized protein DUF2837 [Hasllibacter halocynthiae]
MIPLLVIPALYAAFVFMDTIVILTRVGSSMARTNAMGGAIEKMANACKSLFFFCYPPFLGLLVYRGDPAGVYAAIFASYAAATLAVGAAYALRRRIVAFSTAFASELSGGKAVHRAIASAAGRRAGDAGPPPDQPLGPPLDADEAGHGTLPPRLAAFCVTVYALYGGAIFLLNLVVLENRQYAPIILQMLGMVNGIGTILLSFVIDPVVARNLDAATNLQPLIRLMLFARLVCYALVSPALFAALYALGLGFD